MVYLVFETSPTGSDRRTYIAGPYANAQFLNGRLWVAGPGSQEAFGLAFQAGAGWRVHDGLGADGDTYSSVVFCSELTPWDQP